MELDRHRRPGVGAIVALAGGLGIVLLLPLYLSQRRDLRLVAWMEREPEHPVAGHRASEEILDRAETEIEGLTGEHRSRSTASRADAAARVTSERPALERVTMERAALLPHPRWRRFATGRRSPVAGAIAVVALLLGRRRSSDSSSSPRTRREPGRGARIDPADDVAVLNGTTSAGLGGKVGDDVEANGFRLGAITSTTPGFAKTQVLGAVGEQDLGLREARGGGGDRAEHESVRLDVVADLAGEPVDRGAVEHRDRDVAGSIAPARGPRASSSSSQQLLGDEDPRERRGSARRPRSQPAPGAGSPWRRTGASAGAAAAPPAPSSPARARGARW